MTPGSIKLGPNRRRPGRLRLSRHLRHGAPHRLHVRARLGRRADAGQGTQVKVHPEVRGQEIKTPSRSGHEWT